MISTRKLTISAMVVALYIETGGEVWQQRVLQNEGLSFASAA